MKSYVSQLDTFLDKMKAVIAKRVKSQGSESKFTSGKVITIYNDDYNFNLDGGRWLLEVDEQRIYDNCGYHYDYSVLEATQLAELTDYIKGYRKAMCPVHSNED